MASLSAFREWMDSTGGRVLTAVVAVVLIVAAIVFWVYRPGGRDSAKDRLRSAGRNTRYYCKACGATGQTNVPIDKKNPEQFASQFPVECPECHETQAVMGLRCGRCKGIFVKPPLSQRLYYCPYCDKKYDLRMGTGAPRLGPGPPPGR